LVVAGDHDAVKVQHTALIAQSIPNSNLWIAPNAGHGLIVFQYKDKFNTEVEDFFNRKFKKIQGYDMFKN
jgi:pimeloyl-ACP methyl ester carboxylesterase